VKFAIMSDDTMKGVAWYVDEAQDFAVRVMASGEPVTWTPAGEMITLNGEHTGWRLMRI